jgi:hypothetical protein
MRLVAKPRLASLITSRKYKAPKPMKAPAGRAGWFAAAVG